MINKMTSNNKDFSLKNMDASANKVHNDVNATKLEKWNVGTDKHRQYKELLEKKG